VLGLPWALAPQDGVEGDEQFPHAGGQGHLGSLAGGAEALVKGAEHGIDADGRQRGHVKGCTDVGPAAELLLDWDAVAPVSPPNQIVYAERR